MRLQEFLCRYLHFIIILFSKSPGVAPMIYGSIYNSIVPDNFVVSKVEYVFLCFI